MRLQDNIDFTTLNWVKGELDETLKQARHALEAYVEEPADASQMRFCATYLHQVQGTLRMVELYGAAMATEEMELLATALLGDQVRDREDAYAVLMRGIVQLPDYLERLQSGHKDIPIVLLPLVNELRTARGEQALAESALFTPDLSRPLPPTARGPARPLADADLRRQAEPLRVQFQMALLQWFRNNDSDAQLSKLTQVCDTLISITHEEEARRLFWVAAGVIEALRARAFEPSPPLKQAIGKVEREIKRLCDAGEIGFRVDPPRELTRALLYYVAHAPTDHGRLGELRHIFSLDALVPSTEELEHARGSMTGHNRALLNTVGSAIKDDLLRVKDALDLHMRSRNADSASLGAQIEILDRVGDTLGMLGLGVPRRVVNEQRQVLQQVVAGGRAADEATLLDVAGALLYVEASLDDQVQHLGSASRSGDEADSRTLPQAESRKVLDAVVQEAQSNFAQAKQCFVAFVESNWDHAQLGDVPRLLEEVAGALRILELDEPPRYLESVRRFTAVELIERRRVPNGPQMDTLADVLASLEYYLEALREQRSGRERILDTTRVSLERLGYWPIPESRKPAAVVIGVAAEILPPAPVENATEDVIDVFDSEVVDATQALIDAAMSTSVTVAEAKLSDSAPVSPPVVKADTDQSVGNFVPGFEDTGEDIDEEIREVFVEEVQEEISNLGELLPEWRRNPNSVDAIKPIRRVFHTLKGSGRLVGALTLGEFSWKVESMLNRVLDQTIEPSLEVVALVESACGVLPDLLDALRGVPTRQVDIEGIKLAADRLAAGERVTYVAPATVLDTGKIVDMPELVVSADVADDTPVEAPEVVEIEALIESSNDDELAADAAVEATDDESVGTAFSIDSVLFEILTAEVAGHLETLDEYIAACGRGASDVTDPVLRAVHTMSGAFAMTEVPHIGDVVGPLESYIKRLLARGGSPSDEGVEVITEAADAVRHLLRGLNADHPRAPAFPELAERIAGLRDTLPEPVGPLLPLHTDAVDERADALEAESAQRAEAERAEAERAEAERVEAERVEAERAEAERAEAERVEAERVEAERVEAERVEAERVEAERVEAERVEAERVEAERVEAERVEAERVEAERVEAERVEAERVEAERVEAERVEAERVEAERVEAERVEAERVEAERVEAERVEAERVEAERVEAESVLEFEEIELGFEGPTATEAAVLFEVFDAEELDLVVEEASVQIVTVDDELALFAEPTDQPSLDVSTVDDGELDAQLAADAEFDSLAEAEHVEAEHVEAERVEAERVEAERVEAERVEAERVEAERVEAERVEAERVEAERVEAERVEAERVEAERVEAERVEAERVEAERVEAERVEAERVEAERVEAERVEAERVEAERVEAERVELAQLEAELAELEELERMEAEMSVASRDQESTIEADLLAEELASMADNEDEVAAAVEALRDAVPATKAAEHDADPDQPLDVADLDEELLDIFLEEGTDILDHSDSLMARVRAEPDDREHIIGLQRDLHTLKGGARMAGIMPIGDLGHVMESLLEAVAEGRRKLGADGMEVLDQAFDRLHRMVIRVGERRALANPSRIIQRLEALVRGESLADEAASEAQRNAQEATGSGELQSTPVVAEVPVAKPSSLLSVETAIDEEDTGVRAPQEQIRIRADLLDRLVNYAGEVAIYRARLEQQVGAFRGSLFEMDQTTSRLREQLRRLDIETEAQIIARYQREGEETDREFDPLELDRFSTLQQLSRGLAESAADLTSLQHTLEELTRQYDTLLLQQSRVSSDLQEGLMRTRMVPFESLVPRLRRIVRQTSGELGKKAQLRVEGAQGEMDRSVLDHMTAPLEHMLRNALAHGLETVAERRAAGKPEEGLVRMVIGREGSEVVIRVADDGRGLNRDAIRRKAIERGLLEPSAQLSDRDLFGFILQAGFSTAETISKISGRGVGMDVVSSEIRQLGGSLHIESELGRGTEFVVRLPFTLAVTQAVFVKLGETQFAVPMSSVQGVARIAPADLDAQLATGDPAFEYAGERYAIHDLGRLLGHAHVRASETLQVPLLLARSGDLRVAISIDAVIGGREIVVKPTGPQINSIPGIFGATVMGDGSVVVILDVAPLVRRAAALQMSGEAPRPVVEMPAARKVPLVMVVDDSITMRKVTGRVLERSGYEVGAAKDGLDAIEKMQERVPDVMLLDIEMPRMDGYELATHMRNDSRLRGVPIIMITSRTGEKHRQRAFEIGVDRYLGKPYQEAELLRNVEEILRVGRD